MRRFYARLALAMGVALLVLGVVLVGNTAAVSRRVHPTITAEGACAPQLLPDMYVWKLLVAKDPGNARVDVTMYAPDWQWDRTNLGMAWSTPFFEDIGSWINVTENLGPTLWVRWSDSPETVFRFDAQTLCAIDQPPIDYGPPPTCCWEPAEGESPPVTPPPTSTLAEQRAARAPMFIVAGVCALIVLVLLKLIPDRDL